MRDDPLSILLIEENPGDARLIEEMLRETTELARRTAIDGSDRPLAVHHERRLAAGLTALDTRGADVVLLGLDLPDSTGLDTLAAVLDESPMLPVVVLTGVEDRAVGIQAIEHGAQEYLVKDDVTTDLLVRSIHHAIERNRQDRAEARRREQLEALNRLNRIAQGVTHAVITTSSQEELERAVCDRLVEADAYLIAWIGEVSRRRGTVSPRTSAGVEDGSLEDVSADTVDDQARRPFETAIQDHEVVVMQDVRAAPALERGQGDAVEHGYQSVAAVPILHDDVLYGLLHIYAASPGAFADPAAEILARLGNVIGHAIAAINRKEALVSDAVTELEFTADGYAPELVSLTADDACRIAVRDIVTGEGTMLAYGTATGVTRTTLSDAVERSPVAGDVRVLGGDDAEFEFELATTVGLSLSDALATHGASVDSVTIAEDELRFVVASPGGHDTRSLIDLVTDHCPQATLLAKRTEQRRDSKAMASPAFENRLTEKQWTALETAYLAGHFEWPRETTGEQIAERLGIAPPTFHQHLRAAEKSVFGLLFEEE